jgi:hypothetical protein
MMDKKIGNIPILDSSKTHSVYSPISSIASDEHAASTNPLLVIEETTGAYNRKGDKASCQRNGGINESRARFITQVHVFQRGARSAFLANNLHVHPHYEISQNTLRTFQLRCHDLGIKMVYYPILYNKIQHTSCGSIINVSHVLLQESQKLHSLHKLAKLMDMVECSETQYKMSNKVYSSQKTADCNKRNGFQAHFGFAGNHSTRVEQNGVARPILKTNLDDIQRKDFGTLTSIADAIFIYRKEWDPTLKGHILDDSLDGGIRLRMAQEISQNNKFHAMTVSVVGDDLMTGVHCDNHNDGTVFGLRHNMNFTLINSKTFITDDGKSISIRKIGYAKQSLTDYIRRDSKFEDIDRDEFGPWWDSQPSVRKNFYPDSSLFNPESYKIDSSNYRQTILSYKPSTRDGDVVLFPTFNKHVTYSSAYYDGQQKLFDANPGLERSVQKKSSLF